MFTKQSGSANNWAFGYNKHGPAAREDLEDLVRREAEHCDHLSSFMLIHSAAGGTGSGVGTTLLRCLRCLVGDGCVAHAPLLCGALRCTAGTYVTQLLRDEYGSKVMMCNSVVWPHAAGEVIVQNYNSLLTVSHLCEVRARTPPAVLARMGMPHRGDAQTTDAVLVFENDAAAETCRQLMRLKSPSFDDLNSVIAGQIAMAMLPSVISTKQHTVSAAGQPGVSQCGADIQLRVQDVCATGPQRESLGALIRHCCPHPVCRRCSMCACVCSI